MAKYLVISSSGNPSSNSRKMGRIAFQYLQEAKTGEILISDEMRRALTSPPELAEHPAMELRGRSQSVPVYRVVLQ